MNGKIPAERAAILRQGAKVLLMNSPILGLNPTPFLDYLALALARRCLVRLLAVRSEAV